MPHQSTITLMLSMVSLLLLNIITADAQEANRFISVNPDTQMMTDDAGREMFFHGVNVVYKHAPYHPATEGFGPDTFSEQDMQLLKELGDMFVFSSRIIDTFRKILIVISFFFSRKSIHI